MRITLFLAMLVLFLGSLNALADQVCSVRDGDTLITCQGDKIRLWGIDAPQRKQPYGYQSRNTLRRMVQNQEVFLQCKDKMIRDSLICHVKLHGHSVNRAMVRQGFAFDWLKYSQGVYQEDEAYAKAGRLGVWQQPDGGVRPWVYKARNP